MRALDRERYLTAISLLPREELLSLRDRTASKYPQLKALIDAALEGRVPDRTPMICDHFAMGAQIHVEV